MPSWTISQKEDVIENELFIFKMRYDDGRGPENWYCQFRDAKKKRIRKSTKRKSIGEAVDVAKSLYFEARGLEKAGLQGDERTFSQVAHKYLSELADGAADGLVSKNKYQRYSGIVENYQLEFFGTFKIGEINDQLLEKYKVWRRQKKKGTMDIPKNLRRVERLKREYEQGGDYATLQRMKGVEQRLKNREQKAPSAQTLNYEITALRQVLKFAVSHGYLDTVPVLKNVSLKNQVAERPAFSLDEVKTLIKTADERRKTNEHLDTLTRTFRDLFYYFIRVSFLTGLRTSEQLVLRYEDVSFENSNTRIRVRGQQDGARKTGARTTIASPEVFELVDEMRLKSQFNQNKDYIWSHPVKSPHAGRRIKDFDKTFDGLMTDTGLRNDSDGNRRTLYSLRHAHITEMLNKPNGMTVYQIAQNVGTSPEMIRRHYGKGIVFERIDNSSLLGLD